MIKHLILALVLCLLLTGCVGVTEKTTTDATVGGNTATGQTANTSAPVGSDSPVTDNTKKGREFLVLENGEMRISAEIVLFESDNADAIEKAQTDAITKFIGAYTNGEFSLARQQKDIDKLGDFSILSIDIDAELSHADSNLISIVYMGELTDKGEAHPTQLVFSLNLDAHTLEPINFSEQYKIGDEMYALYSSASATAMTLKWGDKYEEEVGSFADVVCKAEDFQGKIADGSIVVYFTENDVVLSFPIEYILGGHIEIGVPHVQLDTIKADESPLKVLTETADYSITYESYAETPDEADYYISTLKDDGMMVSMYLGTYKIAEVRRGKIINADINGDKTKEIIVHMEISGNGGMLTEICRMNAGIIERIATVEPIGIELLCEYKNGKKARIYSQTAKFSQEVDITNIFSTEAFDNKGMATLNGAVSIKPIHDVSVVDGKLVCTASLCLDSDVPQFDITLSVTLTGGEHTLTPTKILPL